MLSLIWNKRHEELEPETLCSDPIHIQLANAYLCQDCNSVGNCSTQCPACASTVLMNLSAVLNREVEAEVEDFKYAYPYQREYGYHREMVA